MDVPTGREAGSGMSGWEGRGEVHGTGQRNGGIGFELDVCIDGLAWGYAKSGE